VFAGGTLTPLPSWGGHWIAWVLGLSLFNLIGNLGWQYGVARWSASATSIIMLSEIVFASASSILRGASKPSVRTAFGAALILLAALWSARSTLAVRAGGRAGFSTFLLSTVRQ
jgi:drug/metabolite transporter (DMT)-like permease